MALILVVFLVILVSCETCQCWFGEYRDYLLIDDQDRQGPPVLYRGAKYRLVEFFSPPFFFF